MSDYRHISEIEKPLYFSTKMSLPLNEAIFIDQEHEHIKTIKDIIKEQGANVCRNEMDQSYIIECLKTFDYGYVILGNRASIGQKQRGSSQKYVLKGYVLFKYDERLSLLTGKILCGSDGYRGVGRQLLECVADFIFDKRVQTWTIYSLPDEKLIKYYEYMGFSVIDILYRNGKKKVYEMRRKFTYDNVQTGCSLLEECEIQEETSNV